MRRVLITGAEGFTGHYLAETLSAHGCEVHGLCRQTLQRMSKYMASWHEADLADAASLRKVVHAVQPDWVAHLAAVSSVDHGSADEIYLTNICGTRNLLAALCETKAPPSAVLVASSANIYGNSESPVITEDIAPSPVNDYSVSKLAMEYVAKLWSTRLPIIITRPFNYTGVGQTEKFLLPKIVGHFRRKAPVIELGNIDVARDFSDVRTVVDAYRRLLESPAAVGGTYNVCSGKAVTLAEVLDSVRSISGHSINVSINPAFVRANEVRSLRGCPARLESLIGPLQHIRLEETLRWMMTSIA
jgi:nucleoside-diphosphate-sugar epimerase